jgi:hypothetical protein
MARFNIEYMIWVFAFGVYGDTQSIKWRLSIAYR